MYIYLTLDAKGTVKIIAHGMNGEQRSWTFFDLRQLELVEPFNFFMCFGDNDLRTRGNKIRYLVYYYFMLAENAGFIGNPQVQASSQSMLATFCSACRSFESFGHDAGSAGEQLEIVQVAQHIHQEHLSDDNADRTLVSRESLAVTQNFLIVILTVQPEVLAALTEITLLSQRTELLESENEEVNITVRDKKCSLGLSLQKTSSLLFGEVQPPRQEDSNDNHGE